MKQAVRDLERNVAKLGAAVKHLREAVDQMPSTAQFVGIAVIVVTVTSGVLIAVMASQ